MIAPDGSEREKKDYIKYLDKEGDTSTRRYFVNKWQRTLFKLAKAWQKGEYPLPDPDLNAHWRGRTKKYIAFLMMNTKK